MSLLIRIFALFVILASSAAAQIEKLPATVNSPTESDILPVIAADGKSLFFARTRTGIDGDVVFDIWSTSVANDTIYTPADVVGGALASRFGVAVTSVSPDNNTLYLVGKFSEETPPNERLLVTHHTRTGWSIPQPLHIENLNARRIYTDYSFGPDQKTLLISVDRDSTLGDRDLYVSFLTKSGDWTSPRWLGATLNSEYTELTPYLAADGRTLYFSSDRPGGIGEVDVYRATRLDDSWQRWSKPENLGTGINRPGRTTFYTEDASGRYAYFSWRANASDQADLYRAKIAARKPVALLHGRVLDQNGTPIAAKVYYNYATAGASREGALGFARSTPDLGSYQLVLPAGASYSVFADKPGYFVTASTVDLADLKEYRTLEQDLILTKAEVGTHISLRNILFEIDKATLLPASSAQLDQVVDFLTQFPKAELVVRGHTDSTGAADHNMELSRARALAVKEYLVAKGIAAQRISPEGKGASEPTATNSTEEGRAENRRVEFVITRKD